MRRHLMALLVSVLLASLLGGQTLRVSVRDSLTGAPVPRALVTVRQSVVGGVIDVLTNDAGEATIRLPTAGLWTVAVRRVGLAPRVLSAPLVRAGEVAHVTIAMLRVRFTLPPARVVAAAGNCARADDLHDRTSALWEQVTLALRAAATAARDDSRVTALRAVTWDRELDRSLRVVSETPVQLRRGLGRPFSAVDPDSLAALGYVRADPDLTLQYFAPDEHSLASESFSRTHCFDTPRTDADPGVAELRFRPAPSQHAPDIAGTAYVDTSTGALRRIAFRFVNAGALFPDGTDRAGGDVAFEQLPDGDWIVAGWSIRMPRMVRVAWARGPRLTGYHEVGGAVDTLSTQRLSPLALAAPRLEASVPAATGRSRRDAERTRPTGDQAVIGGKLLVGTSAASRRARDWRRDFIDRRRLGVGVFLDSTAFASQTAGSALDLLPRFSGITLFTVPHAVPAPSSVEDTDLADAWIAGATLPMMTRSVPSRQTAVCLVKLFLDGERVSATAVKTTSAATMAAMEYYARPRDVPDGYRRAGNTCGTVLLWSHLEHATRP